MFQKHYGNGYSECPLSAMHAPELADNQLRQRVEQSFNFAEADVLVVLTDLVLMQLDQDLEIDQT